MSALDLPGSPTLGLPADSGSAPASPLVQAGPPCLVVNPRSFSASRGLAAEAMAMAGAQGAEVRMVGDGVSLRADLDAVLARRQGPLIVLAGDGTVQALAERIATRAAHETRPDLLVLPGGRTNFVAADLVPGGKPLAMLARALDRSRRGTWDLASVVQRDTLRLDQDDEPTRHGFFLGAALVDGIIRHCHERRVDAAGMRDGREAGTLRLLAALAWQAARGRSPLSCPTFAIEAGRLGRLDGPVRLFVASTLLHASGLLDPYADRGEGGVRLTAVAHAAPRFWRALPRVLTGRFSPAMVPANGYLSGRTDRVEITGIGGFALDGEEYDVDPARPLVLSRGPSLRFLIP